MTFKLAWASELHGIEQKQTTPPLVQPESGPSLGFDSKLDSPQNYVHNLDHRATRINELQRDLNPAGKMINPLQWSRWTS